MTREKFDAQRTYSEAAATYEDASRRFWQFLSPRTVDRLSLTPGDSVLDVACGTGPGTILAAQAVGPRGRVAGIDYAEGMLEVAREKVNKLGLDNVEFTQGDVTAVPIESNGFDAVMCVLGIFFIDDMSSVAGRLWSSLRPGGRLAVTTFGTEVFEPMLREFVAEAARQQPGIQVILPWRRTEEPEVLRAALEDGGVRDVQIAEEVNELPFEPGDWWNIVTASGLRRTAELLGEAANRVRDSNEAWARDNAIASLRVQVNYALAVKP